MQLGPYRRRYNSEILARPTLDPGRPWWWQLRPWPPGMRFEDIEPVVIELERLVDSTPLGYPPPTLSGGCSALTAIESRFAEIEAVPA